MKIIRTTILFLGILLSASNILFSASITGQIWQDQDNDNLQGASEPRVEGVTVNLLDQDANFITSIVTDPNGEYTFSALTVGDYVIKFDVFSAPIGLRKTAKQHVGYFLDKDSDPDSTGLTGILSITDNSSNLLDIDMGLQVSPTGVVSGMVWNDTDENDIRNVGDVAIEGVIMTLVDSLNTTIHVDTSDANGEYSFLPAEYGKYTVLFISSSFPTGYNPVNKQSGSDITIDSDANSNGRTDTLLINGDIGSIDLGLQNTPVTATLSGKAWDDANSNNIYDAGEVGVPNVYVQLLDISNNILQIDTTDTNGAYSFVNLDYNQYFVRFDTNSISSSYEIATKDFGGDDSIDSDVYSNGSTDTIQLDGNINNIDLGLISTVVAGSLSGKAWYDGNLNSIYDAGEVGVPNIHVQLLDVSNNVLQIDTTDTNGAYSFENLDYNQYFIKFDTSSISSSYEISSKDVGSDDSIDSDVYANGKSDTITLSGNLSNIDIGVYAPSVFGAVNGKVWQDTNGNNLYTFGEPGMKNIPVYLILATSGDTTLTVQTDLSGKYSFSNISPEDYRVAFDMDSIPSTFSVASKNVGTDTSIDSDVDTLGLSDLLTIAAGVTIQDLDLGVIPPSIPVVITVDTIYKNVNKNESLMICLDTFELPGNIQNVQEIIAPQNGHLASMEGNCFTYVPTIDFVGVDSFWVVICDDQSSCDTTFVNINITGFVTALPIAVNDIDTVVQGVPTQLQVISNDTLFAPLTSIKIVDYPTLGSADAESFGFIKYTPEPDICDETVLLSYEICTEFGCDTATVTIYLECNNINISEGFSPNGDGVNDAFVIQGISEYPNNKLTIFNRWGAVILEQEKYSNDWEGFWDDSNTILPDGTYFYIFETGDGGKMTGNFEVRR